VEPPGLLRGNGSFHHPRSPSSGRPRPPWGAASLDFVSRKLIVGCSDIVLALYTMLVLEARCSEVSDAIRPAAADIGPLDGHARRLFIDRVMSNAHAEAKGRQAVSERFPNRRTRQTSQLSKNSSLQNLTVDPEMIRAASPNRGLMSG
jgi:hypothetical protein